MKFTLRFSLFLSLLLMLAASGMSQTFRGSIAGNVVDASGAAVPEATIKLLNDANGFARETVSSASGDFSFSDLPLGFYSLT